MRHLRRLALLLVVLLPVPAAAQGQADTRPGFAVFPFANGGSYGLAREDLAALGVGIQQILLTELSQNTALRIIERGMLREILEEQNLARDGRVDPGTAARIGKLVGARYALTGGFVDLNGAMRLDGHIVDVETSEIIKAEEIRGKRDDLFDLLVDFAGRVTQDVKLPPLAAQVREARKAREIPAEAITLYSRAQVYQDGGRTERAIELYRQIAEKFPAMTEATEALRQLTGGSGD
jgi:TolB-like protein